MRSVVLAVLVGLLGWLVIAATTEAEAVTLRGHVAASCAMLGSRPMPAVFDEDGHALGGSGWLTTSPDSAGCSGRFTITGAPERDRYVVRVGSISGFVPRGSVDLVELAEGQSVGPLPGDH